MTTKIKQEQRTRTHRPGVTKTMDGWALLSLVVYALNDSLRFRHIKLID